jgi:hypothetical protein
MPQHPTRHHAPADQLGAVADLELERLIARDLDGLADAHGLPVPRSAGRASPRCPTPRRPPAVPLDTLLTLALPLPHGPTTPSPLAAPVVDRPAPPPPHPE